MTEFNVNDKQGTVEIVGVQTARCYSYTTYKVTCDKPLVFDDLEKLRAKGLFAHGQRQGEVMGCKNENGKFIYNVITECDSGD
jgi:hypothetical protein